MGSYSWDIQTTSILEKVHKTFFNYYQFHVKANMPDEIVLARMMTALDLEFEIALHHHDEVYESNNDYGLQPYITRLVFFYFMFSVDASFNPADYTHRQEPAITLHPKMFQRPTILRRGLLVTNLQ